LGQPGSLASFRTLWPHVDFPPDSKRNSDMLTRIVAVAGAAAVLALNAVLIAQALL
jgi:hypothetical protein